MKSFCCCVLTLIALSPPVRREIHLKLCCDEVPAALIHCTQFSRLLLVALKKESVRIQNGNFKPRCQKEGTHLYSDAEEH